MKMAQNIQSQQNKKEEKKEEKFKDPVTHKCQVRLPGDSFPPVAYNPFIGLICVMLVITVKGFIVDKYEDITIEEVLLGIVIGYFVGLWYGSRKEETTKDKKKK